MLRDKFSKAFTSILTVALLGAGFAPISHANPLPNQSVNSYFGHSNNVWTTYNYNYANQNFYSFSNYQGYARPVYLTNQAQPQFTYQMSTVRRPAAPQQPVVQQPAQQAVPQQPVKQQPTQQAAPQQPVADASVPSEIQQVLDLVNQERAKAGVSPLKLSTSLDSMAKVKAEDMRDNNYFSHTSPSYGSPFDMMKKFGISFSTAGENIAAGQQSASDVMNSWMNSPGHRQNILNPSYTEIGIGVAKGGSYGTYWVQDFIRP
jgi:uncharacterized YkwD family protein